VMATRTRECDETFARGRLRKAEEFLDSTASLRALHDDEAEVGDSVVSLCVLAGIAASDVICCKALGHFVQGDDHLQAVGELSKVKPDGAEDRKRAWRRAESLVEAARSR
jgi:hypothetical protein